MTPHLFLGNDRSRRADSHWPWLNGIGWAVVLSLVVAGASVAVATILTRQPDPAFNPAPVLASSAY